jgi:hypothetical protein
LFNQTFGVTRPMAQRAFGDRLTAFEEARRGFDPSDRLLNEYFRTVLGSVPQ